PPPAGPRSRCCAAPCRVADRRRFRASGRWWWPAGSRRSPNRASCSWRGTPAGLDAPPVLARQLLVCEPGRTIRRVAHAPPLVLLIGLEIALEPFDMAVALEGEDVSRQAIEEEAVVADDHGAAG